jgi:hypothetical protein
LICELNVQVGAAVHPNNGPYVAVDFDVHWRQFYGWLPPVVSVRNGSILLKKSDFQIT